MKRCCTCGLTKPLESFHRDRHAADGRTRQCGDCRNSYAELKRQTTEAERHELRRQRGEAKQRQEVERAAALAAAVDPMFAAWLVGFADGEGSFEVRIEHPKTGPNRGHRFPVVRCSICQHSRDRRVLDAICDHLGFGRVDLSVGGRLASWRVIRQFELRILVALFDTYPLRTAKRHDFDIWRRAVAAKGSMLNGGSARGNLNARAWTAFEALAAEMRALRLSRRGSELSP